MPIDGDITDLVADWPVRSVAGAVLGPSSVIATTGDLDLDLRVASISKVLAGYTAMIAVEEGTIHLDEPAGPPGATVRHLLSHAAGYGFDKGDPMSPVGRRRNYSNAGIEVFADHLARVAGMPYAEYLSHGVIEPLGMASTRLDGSPAHGIHSSVADLIRFVHELMTPTLVSVFARDAMASIQFPDLAGIVPGVGRFDPNPWGLGPEIKGSKEPHWSGSRTSAATFGHFGGSGTFLWVDPAIDLACVVLTTRGFGDWSMRHWPEFNDRVVERFS